jgi:hypothetical protein
VPTLLTAEKLEAFSGIYLAPRYDSPQPTPDFHREGWELYCSPIIAAGLAAPRNHAKSTAFTHDFILANVCFRIEDYIILIGATEEMAVEHLGDIATELRENEELRRDFFIKGFIQDQKTDIVVECTDGYQLRIVARGAEQKIRGKKWRGRRPGLIVGDDIEDDEMVESKDRRKKFRQWFFRACKQALRDGGRIRIHGTMLHKESLLMRLSHNPSWRFRVYKAHRSSSDFRDILWIEKFDEVRLRSIKSEFESEGDTAGYAQEYLNDPADDDNKYLREEWFHSMTEKDFEEFGAVGVGCDFAVSKADSANRTAFVVGKKTIGNFKHALAFYAGRWDSKEWIDQMFDIHQQFQPEFWFVEDGVIWLSVRPTIIEEMRERDIYFNIIEIRRTKDKPASGTPFRKQMKAGTWKFNKLHGDYPEFQSEALDFSQTAEAKLDDQTDAIFNLAIGFSDIQLQEGDDMTEEEQEFVLQRERLKSGGDGRSEVTGY